MCQYIYTEVSKTGIILVDSPTLYEDEGESMSEATIRSSQLFKHDTVQIIATRSLLSYPMSYKIDSQEGVYWIKSPEIMTEYAYSVAKQEAMFSMQKEKANEAWSRAYKYIKKNSTMKIQNSSEFHIETYNPIKSVGRGFSITKVLMGDRVEFEIDCIIPMDIYRVALYHEKRCAYYMRTGKLEYMSEDDIYNKNLK